MYPFVWSVDPRCAADPIGLLLAVGALVYFKTHKCIQSSIDSGVRYGRCTRHYFERFKLFSNIQQLNNSSSSCTCTCGLLPRSPLKHYFFYMTRLCKPERMRTLYVQRAIHGRSQVQAEADERSVEGCDEVAEADERSVEGCDEVAAEAGDAPAGV